MTRRNLGWPGKCILFPEDADSGPTRQQAFASIPIRVCMDDTSLLHREFHLAYNIDHARLAQIHLNRDARLFAEGKFYKVIHRMPFTQATARQYRRPWGVPSTNS